MKNLIYSKIMVAILVSLFTISSSFAQEKKKEEKAVTKSTTYVCPMDCEKGKTYKAKGKCKVCKMDLVIKTDKKKSETVPATKKELTPEEKKHGHSHGEEGHSH